MRGIAVKLQFWVRQSRDDARREEEKEEEKEEDRPTVTRLPRDVHTPITHLRDPVHAERPVELHFGYLAL